MSFEDFQLLEDSTIDNQIIKIYFMRKCHQRGARLNNSNQCIDFFGGKNYYHQIGKGYLELDIELNKKLVILIKMTLTVISMNL